MNDLKALRLLGLALRSGRLEVGADNAAALAASGRARLVVVASDISPHAAKRVRAAAEGSGVPCAALPCTKAELGAALGRAECAAAATADPGFSKAIAQSISNGGGNSIEHHS